MWCGGDRAGRAGLLALEGSQLVCHIRTCRGLLFTQTSVHCYPGTLFGAVHLGWHPYPSCGMRIASLKPAKDWSPPSSFADPCRLKLVCRHCTWQGTACPSHNTVHFLTLLIDPSYPTSGEQDLPLHTTGPFAFFCA